MDVKTLTVLGGTDKNGQKEEVTLSCAPGDVICVVGPTGSGKSRFLSDIEALAQGDTVSGRRVLVNGSPIDMTGEGTFGQKIVAQLSQQMNFVMDLAVEDFLLLHAESRLVPDADAMVRTILTAANELAGEKFTGRVSVTQLSGGQSRALMIADTALLSPSPIVLIDEIENAGINRRRALELLVKKEKITFIATHDPVLALMGTRRIFFRDGGIAGIIVPDKAERESALYVQQVDDQWVEWRETIRNGNLLHIVQKR
ncbi:MAG: ATP-binding cassette domain-containing protein [Methanoregula sp.]|nr:ATP-binding cassette domain-containing protein [Methanoregula sp.]